MTAAIMCSACHLPCRMSWLAMIAAAVADPPTRGPYATGFKVFQAGALDKTDQHVHVFYPTNTSSDLRFPLISYAHGAAGGGELDIIGYHYIFSQMASFGYVVAAPASCSEGCADHSNRPYTDCAGLLPISSPAWNSWFGEQLKTIVWARNSTDAIFNMVSWDMGVGIAGHSMGGQATTTSAHFACAAKYNIKAAVLHHAAGCDLKEGGGNAGANITIPLAAYTSSGDHCCEQTTKDVYKALPSTTPKVYRDLKGSSHLEPVLWPVVTENPLLGTYTAAWFDIFIKQQRNGTSAWGLIYGGGPDSLCKFQEMEECEVGQAL